MVYYLSLSSLKNNYSNFLKPIVDFYDQYYNQLQTAIQIYNDNNGDWSDFYSTVNTVSSQWLQPFTIFYPILLQDPFTTDDIININDWVREYFPIKNTDETLNYVQGQKIIVNCYTYTIDPQINIFDQPESYCDCQTQSKDISVSCQSLRTGGLVICENGNHDCNFSINCSVACPANCYYLTPYLDQYGIKIAPDNTKVELSIGKIQANISMKFTDRYESSIQTMIFEVYDCDWQYTGSNILL